MRKTETIEEVKEGLRWAEEELKLIRKYEKEGKRPDVVVKKRAVETIVAAYRNILAFPTDPRRGLWEKFINLCFEIYYDEEVEDEN